MTKPISLTELEAARGAVVTICAGSREICATDAEGLVAEHDAAPALIAIARAACRLVEVMASDDLDVVTHDAAVTALETACKAVRP